MKSILRLSVCIFILWAAFNPAFTVAQGTGNHITMSLKNCFQISDTAIQFDLTIISDGATGSSLRINSCSYGINFDSTILAGQDTAHISYVAGTSQIFLGSQLWNILPCIYRDHLRLTEPVWAGGNIWGEGIIDVADTDVTLTGGDHFICSGCGRSVNQNLWNGGPIVINGITYNISVVKDSMHLTLQSSAGTQTSVSYSVNSPNIVNPMPLNHEFIAGTFIVHDSLPFVNGTIPNFKLQDVTSGGRTKCLALVYKDTASGTSSLSLTGINDGQRSVSEDCNLLITSAKQREADRQLQIYPNPVSDRFTLAGLQGGEAMVEVFNILGKKVYSQLFADSHSKETISCKLSAGVYFVQVNNDRKVVVRKIVVQ